MAQSPEANAAGSEILRYDLGWNAINSLLRSGRSLSGHERNCCFLNTGGERFADVSAAAGLDFIDDGRVVALSDWDCDGDLDFWVANRSGPQLRFLENRAADGRQFIALRLVGVSGNRDAIGAVVKVRPDDGEGPVQTKTLRAGDGYLSQSSKWLHFGLGDARSATVTVRWPGGGEANEIHTSKIGSLAAGRWHVLREGRAEPEAWEPPGAWPRLATSPLEPPPTDETAHVVLLRPLPTPALDAAGEGSAGVQPVDLKAGVRSARLVTLWASWCAPCLEELSAWKERSAALEEAGVEVVMVNADGDFDGRSRLPSEARDAVAGLGLPWTSLVAPVELVETLDVLQRSIFARQRPLPVPSSFLLDAAGDLRAVYKGPVPAERLLRDAATVAAGPEEALLAASPFPGTWSAPPGGTTPLTVGVKLVEAGRASAARAYLEPLVARDGGRHAAPEILNLIGAIAIDMDDPLGASRWFKKTLAIDPGNRQAHIELGTLKLRAGDGAGARGHFETALETNPSDPELLAHLGTALLLVGETERGIEVVRRALALRPDPVGPWQLAELHLALGNFDEAAASYSRAIDQDPERIRNANNLAWILATSDQPSLRDGERAVEIAEAVARKGGQPSAGELDTLGAAYAEAGRFDDAVLAAESALVFARQAGDHQLEGEIRGRLAGYRLRRPYHAPLGR